MSDDPILALAQLPATVRHDAPGVEQPAPSVEQEQLSDDVFARGAAALLAMQAGAAAAGLIIDNATEKPLPKKVPPRLPEAGS